MPGFEGHIPHVTQENAWFPGSHPPGEMMARRMGGTGGEAGAHDMGLPQNGAGRPSAFGNVSIWCSERCWNLTEERWWWESSRERSS